MIMMKILFINKFLSKGAINREPLGILSLTAAISGKHQVFILEPTRDDIDQKIKSIKPDVIAYSIRTSYHKDDIDLNRKLKSKYKFISVFGGPHATLFPDMINEKGVDCICRGEGEEALLEFLDTLENKGDITKIRNFWVKKNKKIYKNPVRPLVQNLDKLRFPDRSLLDDYKEIKSSKVKNFITGRGCPFECSYCFNAGFKKIYCGQNYVRKRSVANVIKEIKNVRDKYGIEIAILEDDTININKKWLLEFCKKFKTLGVKFICIGVRADLVDEEMVRALKKGHCIGIVFGIESGNEKVRREILNRHMSNKQIITCAKLFRKYRINYTTENILGIPTTSLEEDLDTLKLNVICQPMYSNAHIMQPYPSTKIYEFAVKKGLYQKHNFDDLNDFFIESKMQIENKYERENLQRLFSLAVHVPVIYSNIRLLIRLPLRVFYDIIFNIYKVYIGNKWMPSKRSFTEYWSLFRRYFCG